MVVKKPVEERDETISRIIGVDSSSTGLAWTLLVDGEMVDQGKIKLDKIKNIYGKLAHIYIEWGKLLEDLKPDIVFVEKSIFVKNPATARVLSYVVGAILASVSARDIPVVDVEPSTWKAFFKYRNISSQFVAQAKTKLGSGPGGKLCDELRKSQTWRVIRHNRAGAEGSLADSDHDIADSWGVALYGCNLRATPITLEISDGIRVDLERLASLGLKL